MRVEFVMVADAAQVVAGKLYVLGGAWDQFRSTSFPTQMPVAIVASVLAESATDTGKPISVNLLVADEQGVPVMPEIQVQVQIERAEGSRPPYRVLVPTNAVVPIPREGRYTAQVTAGDSVNSVHFDVRFVGRKAEIVPSQTTPLH